MDPAARHVQDVTRRELSGHHLDAQLVLKQKLDAHEVDQREFLLRVVVDEQIKIAVGLRFIPRSGAKRA